MRSLREDKTDLIYGLREKNLLEGGVQNKGRAGGGNGISYHGGTGNSRTKLKDRQDELVRRYTWGRST